jgi:hypothetical protein
MTMGEAIGRGPRIHLVNLITGEDREPMFNPEQLVEELSINYSKLAPQGMSHEIPQYRNTGNHSFPLDLYMEAHSGDGADDIEDFRNFCFALAYAPGGAGTIDSGAPPRVLIVWPNVVSMTCILLGIRSASTRFSVEDLRITRCTISLTLEEIRDARMTSEDVRRNGTRRSSAGGGSSAV